MNWTIHSIHLGSTIPKYLPKSGCKCKTSTVSTEIICMGLLVLAQMIKYTVIKHSLYHKLH